jgi:hypothetical protein
LEGAIMERTGVRFDLEQNFVRKWRAIKGEVGEPNVNRLEAGNRLSISEWMKEA